MDATLCGATLFHNSLCWWLARVLSSGTNQLIDDSRIVQNKAVCWAKISASRLPAFHSRLPWRVVLQECSLLEFLVGLLELFLRVHDDRAVPGYGLLERLPRNQEEADAVVTGLHRNLVAPVEQHKRAVVGLL